MLFKKNKKGYARLFMLDLTKNFKARADDNHATQNLK